MSFTTHGKHKEQAEAPQKDEPPQESPQDDRSATDTESSHTLATQGGGGCGGCNLGNSLGWRSGPPQCYC